MRSRESLILLSSLAMLAFASLSVGMEPPQADAEAAIAMAKAKSNTTAVAATRRHVPYADAAKLSLKTGKPVVVIVGIECGHLCPSLRPEMITCNEREHEGSTKPRVVLLLPGKDGSMYRVETWEKLPDDKTIRAAAKAWASKVLSDSPDILASFLIGLIAINPGECPGGVCPIPSAPAAVASVREPPMQSATPAAAGVHIFVADHPRIAALRSRIRGRFNLSPPRVRGGFVSLESIASEPVEGPKPTPVGDAPSRVVGVADADDLASAMESDIGRRFRAKLRDYRPGERIQILVAGKAMKADGGKWVDVLETLFKLMLEYGPKLIEVLKLLGIL